MSANLQLASSIAVFQAKALQNCGFLAEVVSGKIAGVFCLFKLNIDGVYNVILQGNKAFQRRSGGIFNRFPALGH
jgi:hypothetical protein